MKKNHGELEFSRITPYIYIGTNMCSNMSCNFHFGKLKKLKINADIDLEIERIEKPHNLEAYLWIPTKDHKAPSQSQLKTGVSFLKQLVKEKKRVYVHCKQGHGRSPTLVAAYFINRGMDVRQAIDFIKKRRPAIHLTESQVKALIKFKKNLKK